MKSFSRSELLVDHHPSIIKAIFPKETITKLPFHFRSLNKENIRKFLGRPALFGEFEKNLIYNVFPSSTYESLPFYVRKKLWKFIRDEFHNPVLSLWFYKDLEEVQSAKNKEALRVHGASHGIMDALNNPSYNHLLRRIIEIVDDIIFVDSPRESAIGVKNNQLLITSLLPTEELKATFLKDFALADKSRKRQLLRLKNIKLEEGEESRLKFNWPYVISGRSWNVLNNLGFKESEIERIINLCNDVVNVFEIRESENWTKMEDVYLSNLPHFLTILSKAEEIGKEDFKDRFEKIREILHKPMKVNCINIAEFLRIPEWKDEDLYLKKVASWKVWKIERVMGALQEGKIAEAALFDLADYIIFSIIATYGKIDELLYEVLVPKAPKHESQIYKVVMKIKFLLLKVCPAFSYNLVLKKAYTLKSYGEQITFPLLQGERLNVIKSRLQDSEEYARKIEQELKEYAKISKLNKRMESALKYLSTPM
jgi:hypothetical protein